MLALIYLGLAIALGDLLCRRFYRFVSVPHRCAAAILVGILLSTWITYWAGLAFAHTSEPLLFSELLFYLQAGNLEFLGLNLAWSVDLLSVLGLTSTLALVMALGELLFNSRVVGRLGATLFFFHGSLQRVTNFLATGYAHRHETWGFWKQIAFVDQRHVPFATGIFLLVLIFSVDQYRRRPSAAGASSDDNIALREPKQATSQNPLKIGFPST